MPTIHEMFDKLSELEAQLDLLGLQRQDRIDQIMTQEIKNRLAEIEIEFLDKGHDVSMRIAWLEGEIKAEALKCGASVKGKHYQAVYNRGRVSWDTKKLDGLMILLPQLSEARTEGAPYITIRKVSS